MSATTKILVVDDEPIGRQLLEAILLPEGYQIFFGSDGEEALRVAYNELPDIILLDVMMPKKDGFETCRELRKNDTTAHIPVFLITALDDRDSRIRGLDAGADDYISKPFDRVEILAKIKNKSSQIDIRRKDTTIPSAELSSTNASGLNEYLIDALIHSLLQDNFDLPNVFLYRSTTLSESQHAMTNVSTPLGNYCILLSNKLSGKNAAILNSIFNQYLIHTINSKSIGPGEVIVKFNSYIRQLVSESDPLQLIKAEVSLIIFLQLADTREIILAGINQSIYICQTFSSPNNDDFQHFYLQGNQELKFNSHGELVLFSRNISEQKNPKDIITFLNTHFKRSANNSYTESIQTEFNKMHDILVVKLTV
jgi:DNA-binding response OmpR family regulator